MFCMYWTICFTASIAFKSSGLDFVLSMDFFSFTTLASSAVCTFLIVFAINLTYATRVVGVASDNFGLYSRMFKQIKWFYKSVTQKYDCFDNSCVRSKW